MIPVAGKGIEQQELSVTVHGNIKWPNYSKDSLVVSYKAQNCLAMQSIYVESCSLGIDPIHFFPQVVPMHCFYFSFLNTFEA